MRSQLRISLKTPLCLAILFLLMGLFLNEQSFPHSSKHCREIHSIHTPILSLMSGDSRAERKIARDFKLVPTNLLAVDQNSTVMRTENNPLITQVIANLFDLPDLGRFPTILAVNPFPGNREKTDIFYLKHTLPLRVKKALQVEQIDDHIKSVLTRWANYVAAWKENHTFFHGRREFLPGTPYRLKKVLRYFFNSQSHQHHLFLMKERLYRLFFTLAIARHYSQPGAELYLVTELTSFIWLANPLAFGSQPELFYLKEYETLVLQEIEAFLGPRGSITQSKAVHDLLWPKGAKRDNGGFGKAVTTGFRVQMP